MLADIMFDAVRNGTSEYTEQQRAAWVPVRRDGQPWTDRLAAQQIVVGERDGRAVEFMSLASGGYVDFAYIRPIEQGRGLFRQMFELIEQQAITKVQADSGFTQAWPHGQRSLRWHLRSGSRRRFR